MGLSREVDDRVRPGDDAVDQIGVSNIALDDGQARGELGGNVSQGRAVARIGELIEDDDVDIRMILKERVGLCCRVRSTLPPLCRTSARR